MITPLRLSEAALLCNARLIGNDREFSGIFIDSRTVVQGGLFTAVVGERHDGHDYIDSAHRKGAVAALVSRESEQRVLPQLLVEDTVQALGQLAAAQRRQFDGRCVALTGSAGKTTCKELIGSIMAQAGEVHKTVGNLNNELGVPLTLLALEAEHRSLVAELGASAVGDIAYLAAMVAPDVALITNAGAAHLEYFGSVAAVVEGKGEIIDAVAVDGTVVLPRDDPAFSNWQKRAGQRRVISFGRGTEADVRLLSAHPLPERKQWQRISLSVYGEEIECELALEGGHNALNAAAAVAVAYAQDIAVECMIAGLAAVELPAGRLQLVRTAAPAIIDDSYNANPLSVGAAIDVLAERKKPRWLILGEMAELGEDVLQFQHDIGSRARKSGIDCLWCCGDTAAVATAFGNSARHFATTGELCDNLSAAPDCNSILIKGSRVAAMEQVATALLSRYRQMDSAQC